MSELSFTTEENKEEYEKKNVTYSFNWQFTTSVHEELEVKADVSPVFAFALYQNGTPLVERT